MAKVCAGRAIANSGYGCYINHSYLLRTGPSPTLAMGAILTILRYLPRTGPSPTMAIEAILTIVAICTIVHHPPPTTHHPPPTAHRHPCLAVSDGASGPVDRQRRQGGGIWRDEGPLLAARRETRMGALRPGRGRIPAVKELNDTGSPGWPR